MVDRAAYIAVDWGTTNRRAFAMSEAGTVLDSLGDDRGILALTPDADPGESAALRGRCGALPGWLRPGVRRGGFFGREPGGGWFSCSLFLLRHSYQRQHNAWQASSSDNSSGSKTTCRDAALAPSGGAP